MQTNKTDARRAILVGMYEDDRYEAQDSIDELAFLAKTAGIKVLDKILQRRKDIDVANYIGHGKVLFVLEKKEELKADVVIFDNELKPLQIRNLEKILKSPVFDRTELILYIFALRARTSQAKLQVESATLQYELPRLRHMWTHFTKMEGGRGAIGGFGETQLEIDKRRIRKKIQFIEKKLKELEQKREVERKGRKDFFRVSLVGYTNVGKSTLLNSLSGSDVFVENKLFATLDATTRRVELDKHRSFLLTDTVGFIKKLPHHLVTSFHATLSEIQYTDLILHVVDISHPNYEQQINVVDETLKEIGCDSKEKKIVFNKMDLIEQKKEIIDRFTRQYPGCFLVSAVSGFGLAKLKEFLSDQIDKNYVITVLRIKAGQGKQISLVRAKAEILDEHYEGDEWVCRIRIAPKDLAKFDF